MIRTARAFLIFEAITFSLASAIHRGALVQGYEHREAFIAESVIAVVLLLGLLVTRIAPNQAFFAAIAAQGFALLGTAVGLFTIVIGIGPRSVPDVIYHVGIVLVLISGFVVLRNYNRDVRNGTTPAARDQ